MKIAVPKEKWADEARVSVSPSSVKKFIAMGFDVVVESGAGDLALIPDAALSEAGTATVAKVKALEGIIMPLLLNLKKTADKEYIYWPNRTEAIDKEIQRVLSITRG